MRHATMAVVLGGVLLTGTACDSEAPTSKKTDAAPVAVTTPPSAPADYTADTKAVCTRLTTVFGTDLNGFATQVGKMIANKEARHAPEAAAAQKAAANQLRSVGAKVRKETATAQDPELRSAGATSAAKFIASADDKAFFDQIKSTTDLSRTIESKMSDWLSPVAGYCG